MEVGSLVAHADPSRHLRCASAVYDRAVVASTQPFVLVSEEGDMRWCATVGAEAFREVGTASPRAAANVLDRIARDAEAGALVGKEARKALRRIAGGRR